ncbi:MAG: CPBP family intramembrane glutamic endopeptidase, partial [Elusimicrobiota bacterium]
PRAARAALISGAVLVAASAAAFAFPALTPAALAVMKGPALYVGLALMSLSRYWRVPGTGVESPRGPPESTGWFKALKATWSQARYGADAQAALESRAGGSSIRSFRDWLLGGLRAAALWLPLGIATMVAGWGLAKPFARFGNPDDAVGMISFDSLEKLSLGGHLLGFVAASLAAQAVTLWVFDGIRALASKAGAGRASGWIAGAAALAVSAGLIMMVTTTPSVVGTMLGLEAGVLWLRARSGSWLAPLALRGIFSLLSLEFARIAVGMAMPVAGVLAGLPAVWTGVAAAGILFAGLAWAARSLRPSALWGAFQAQLQRVRDFGAAWRTPNADGAPHSPWPLMKLAALWGMILYALGDLSFSGVHALTGGAEPTPGVLVQMLSLPVDLVLANFLLVGFLEEFVFRRGLFKPILNRLKNWKLNNPKAFWTAAVVSGLIFSYAHYIDFAALLAHVGVGSAPVASGMYAFSLGGFLARAILGVALAWLYAASGTLLLPILAHFLADSYEGLGLHLGFVPFLAMAAVAVLLQLQGVWKTGKTQRS